MLNGDALLTWLDGSSQMKELEGLLEPSVPFSLRIQDVDRAVNQVRRKDQRLSGRSGRLQRSRLMSGRTIEGSIDSCCQGYESEMCAG